MDFGGLGLVVVVQLSELSFLLCKTCLRWSMFPFPGLNHEGGPMHHPSRDCNVIWVVLASGSAWMWGLVRTHHNVELLEAAYR